MLYVIHVTYDSDSLIIIRFTLGGVSFNPYVSWFLF